MRVQEKTAPEFRVLKETEIEGVAGGYFILPTIDVTQIEDRLVGGCGTMQILNRFLRRTHGAQ